MDDILKANVDKLEKQVAALTSERDALSKQLHDSDVKTVRAELDGSKTLLDTAKSEIADLRAKLATAKSEMDEEKAKREKAEKDKNDFEAKMKKFEKDKTKADRLAKLLKSNVDEAKATSLVEKAADISDEMFDDLVSVVASPDSINVVTPNNSPPIPVTHVETAQDYVDKLLKMGYKVTGPQVNTTQVSAADDIEVVPPTDTTTASVAADDPALESTRASVSDYIGQYLKSNKKSK